MRLLTTLFLVLLAPFAPPASHAGEETLVDMLRQSADTNGRAFSMEEYMHHRDVVKSILKACPPAECVYLGLGRSPTVYMAMLENLAPGSVHNLPLSLSMVPRQADGSLGLSKAEWDKLDEHFKRFLPDPSKLGGKRVMMVDFVHSGKGALKARQLVKNHYKRTAPSKVEIDMFAFGNEDTVETVIDKVQADGGRAFGFTDPGAGWGPGRAGQWTSEAWDNSALYDSYIPGGKTQSADLKPRPQYKALVSQTQKYLELDPDPALAKYRKAGARGPAASGGPGCTFKDIAIRYASAIRELGLTK